MQELIISIKSMFDSIGYGPMSVAFAFLLGLLSAVASACCTLPLFGILAGYSVVRKDDSASIFRNGLLFMAGVVFTLLVIGVMVVFAGQTIQKVSGSYWKIAVGCAAIFFGIGALRLFPFQLPKLNPKPAWTNLGSIGSGISGIVLGGAIAVSSLPCNPGIFVILGAAVLQRHILWAILNLSTYAIGFSLPLTLLVCGISFGKGLKQLQKMEPAVRYIAGVALIAAGFYFFYDI